MSGTSVFVPDKLTTKDLSELASQVDHEGQLITICIHILKYIEDGAFQPLRARIRSRGLTKPMRFAIRRACSLEMCFFRRRRVMGYEMKIARAATVILCFVLTGTSMSATPR